MRKAKPRQLEPMICRKCGNDRVSPSEVKTKHGVKRCTRAKNRPKYCVLCHEEFITVKAVTLKVTNFGKMKKEQAASDAQVDEAQFREIVDTVRETRWPAGKIYKHLEEHRRLGDTPEAFFGVEQ